jgi:hypothetical protein
MFLYSQLVVTELQVPEFQFVVTEPQGPVFSFTAALINFIKLKSKIVAVKLVYF